LIEAIGLTKKFSSGYALENLTVEIGEEKVAILGFNGAGKSTFARLVSGQIKPSKGKILVMGSEPHKNPDVRKRIGIVTHNPMLYGELTVKENLIFYAKLYDVNRNAVVSVMEEMGLEKVTHLRVSTLSRGLKQRVAIARAIMIEPQVLVMDEATAGLDVESREWFSEYLQNYNGCLLFATHIIDEAEFCKKYLVLESGRMKYYGCEFGKALEALNVSGSNKKGY
jgi:ABC-type multidrug transport system ATPase subunit